SSESGWALADKDKTAVPKANMSPILRILGDLKAKSVPAIAPEAAGLAEPDKAQRIALKLKDGTEQTLLLGNTTAPDSKDRFARVADGLVFVLASYNADKLAPNQETLTKEPPPPPPPGGMPGMPGGMGMPGMPPGMPGGLPPGVKIQ
ncbi:MAG: DUF4340 domain-containing protein, partial [Myxococcota bacterium]